MLNQITKVLSLVSLFALVLIVYSCNDSLNSETEVDQVQIFDKDKDLENLYNALMNLDQDISFAESQDAGKIDMKEFLRQTMGSNKSLSFCEDTPNCPKVTITGVYNYSSTCDFEYSYTLYNCGSGNLAIFDFTINPVVGSACTHWDTSVVAELAAGNLEQYTINRNLFIAEILSDIEDNIFNFISNPPAQILVASYIKNVCSLKCDAQTGRQEVCGEEC